MTYLQFALYEVHQKLIYLQAQLIFATVINERRRIIYGYLLIYCLWCYFTSSPEFPF